MAIRASVSRVRTTVHSSRIAMAFVPGGMIWDNMRRLMATSVAVGRSTAPRRTGHLASTIGSVLTPSGKNQCRGTLYADADYAKFVINGTRAMIRANMKVRLAPHSRYTRPTPGVADGVLRRAVRGQRANDFIGRAVSRAMRIHGVR